MAVMALFRSAKVDQALYDTMMEELGVLRDPPPGALSHVCGFDDQGIYVVDVWETRADLEAFVTDKLLPVAARLNLDIEPPVVVDAYKLRTTQGMDLYKLELAPG